MKREISILKNGIVGQNPVFVLLLGMCPMLATSTTVANALGMGAAVISVLVCSNLFISLLRSLIPEKIRIASYVVIAAGFVTLVEMILKAYFPSIAASLGLFIPLIVVNCVILARAELFASKNNPLASAADGLGMGAGFALALVLMAVVREFLGSGSLLNIRLLPEGFPRTLMMTRAPGGFLTLGCLIALIQFISKRRARFTGKGLTDQGGAEL
jgi:electron transport complex protein RnfE